MSDAEPTPNKANGGRGYVMSAPAVASQLHSFPLETLHIPAITMIYMRFHSAIVRMRADTFTPEVGWMYKGHDDLEQDWKEIRSIPTATEIKP